MKLPNEVAPGQPISAKDFNTLLRYLRSLKLTGGPGIWVTQTMAGTSVKLAPDDAVQTKAAPSAEYKHPFKCTIDGTKISIVPGFVNGQVPTINSVALDNDPAPVLYCGVGFNVVYLKVSGTYDPDTGAETVARAIIEIAAALPQNTATEYAWSAYQTLTQFVYVDEDTPVGKLPQFIQVNLKAANFGRSSTYFA